MSRDKSCSMTVHRGSDLIWLSSIWLSSGLPGGSSPRILKNSQRISGRGVLGRDLSSSTSSAEASHKSAHQRHFLCALSLPLSPSLPGNYPEQQKS